MTVFVFAAGLIAVLTIVLVAAGLAAGLILLLLLTVLAGVLVRLIAALLIILCHDGLSSYGFARGMGFLKTRHRLRMFLRKPRL